MYPEVASRVQDAPASEVASACRRTLAMFFRDSTCWRERFHTTALVADQATYNLATLTNKSICAITKMHTYNKQQIVRPITEIELDHQEPGWRVQKGNQPWRYLCPESTEKVLLWPIPDVAGDFLDVELALYPNADTEEIPDSFGNLYFDRLVDGACGVLYRIPRRVWTDMRLGKDAEESFEAAMISAKGRIAKSNTTGITIARMTGFAEL